jgi:molybdopterin converting factor subunit 1
MRITVKLFAVARQRAGREVIEVELPQSATVAHLRSALAEQHPSLAGIVPHARFAIDSEYAADQNVIPANAQIAIIPPVSGG